MGCDGLAWRLQFGCIRSVWVAAGLAVRSGASLRANTVGKRISAPSVSNPAIDHESARVRGIVSACQSAGTIRWRHVGRSMP